MSDSSRNILIYEYSTGEQLLEDMCREHNVLFIDVQMSGMDGNKTALEIRKANRDVLLVFYSGVVQPTTDSFKVQPYRYLMKQFDKEKMHMEIKEILQEMNKRAEMPYIGVSYDGGIAKIRIEDIIYVSNHNKMSRLWIEKNASKKLGMIKEASGYKNVFFYQKKLSDVYLEISRYGFEYPHNSYIVNFKHVIRKEKNIIKLTDGIELNCSRSKVRDFVKKFEAYLECKLIGEESKWGY